MSPNQAREIPCRFSLALALCVLEGVQLGCVGRVSLLPIPATGVPARYHAFSLWPWRDLRGHIHKDGRRTALVGASSKAHCRRKSQWPRGFRSFSRSSQLGRQRDSLLWLLPRSPAERAKSFFSWSESPAHLFNRSAGGFQAILLWLWRRFQARHARSPVESPAGAAEWSCGLASKIGDWTGSGSKQFPFGSGFF